MSTIGQRHSGPVCLDDDDDAARQAAGGHLEGEETECRGVLETSLRWRLVSKRLSRYGTSLLIATARPAPRRETICALIRNLYRRDFL